jgi:Lysylphosphatidylglycerol synthase TM region
MKLNKNSKIFFNYILGPLLFVWLSVSLYSQIRNQENLQQSWLHIKQSFNSPLIWNLVLVVALMFVNWSIEALKWQMMVKPVQPIGFGRAFKAILSGVSFSVTTPNRVGEYLGRVLYMDDGNRLRTISLTIVCSMSQLLITLLMGVSGLVALYSGLKGIDFMKGLDASLWMRVILYGTLLVLVILTVFYFRLSWLTRLIDKLPGFARYAYLVRDLEDVNATLLVKLLSLSAVRFVVFGIQYFLLFRLFGVEVDWWQSFWSMSIIFLVLAVIPTFAIAELGIRGEVTVNVLKLFTVNALGITLATATIWFINLILPAVAGSILILGIKVFKQKNEAS